MLDWLHTYLARAHAPAFDTAVCGHRGASAAAPENTLAAFHSALDAGCDLVELDVLLTRDQELVVIHDNKLGRTTNGSGKVTQLTLEEIRSCDAGLWFTDLFEGERVPVLEEALEAIRDRATAMIELKQASQKAPGLVDRLGVALETAGAQDRAIVIAWNLETATAVRKRCPEALVALSVFTRRGLRKARAADLDGVVTYRRSATRRFLDEAHNLGLFVAPWTVNRPRDMRHFCLEETDIVITDLPHALVDTLEQIELQRTRDLLTGTA